MKFQLPPHAPFRCLLVLAAVLAATVSSQAANVFDNAGFETGDFTSWNTAGGSVTSTFAHTGTYSFSGLNLDNVGQSFAPVATSSVSELSFWGMRTNGLFDLITLSYSDGSSENVFANTLGGSSDWTFVDLTSQLDAGKSLNGFLIWGTSPGPVYLDDFKLEARSSSNVPDSASSLSLLALGLAGVIGCRSRMRKPTRN